LFTNSKVTLAYVYLSKINCVRNFRQLSLLAAIIYEMDQDINNWKQTGSTAISTTLGKKFDELWSISGIVLLAYFNSLKVDCARDYR